MVKRKQLDSCGRGVAALNKVGEAWVNNFSDIILYVSMKEEKDHKLHEVQINVILDRDSYRSVSIYKEDSG